LGDYGSCGLVIVHQHSRLGQCKVRVGVQNSRGKAVGVKSAQVAPTQGAAYEFPAVLACVTTGVVLGRPLSVVEQRPFYHGGGKARRGAIGASTGCGGCLERHANVGEAFHFSMWMAAFQLQRNPVVTGVPYGEGAGLKRAPVHWKRDVYRPVERLRLAEAFRAEEHPAKAKPG